MTREEFETIIKNLKQYRQELISSLPQGEYNAEEFFLHGAIQMLDFAFAVRSDGEPMFDEELLDVVKQMIEMVPDALPEPT